MIIIAEIGVNHNGSLEIAKKLVSYAKDCGADIVNFRLSKQRIIFQNMRKLLITKK